MRVSEKISVNIKNVVVVFVAYRSIFVVRGMQKRLRTVLIYKHTAREIGNLADSLLKIQIRVCIDLFYEVT